MNNNEEIQRQIDITIKNGVDPKHDEELGLTGRNLHQVILRLATALEERDKQIEQLEAVRIRK